MTWVHERIFAAGGDHIPDAWQEFADQTGISAVLHLRPGGPAPFHGPPPAAFLWLGLEAEEGAGIEARWLAGQFVLDSITAGHSVLLHSSLGRHRARWAYVAYRICAGASPTAAVKQAAEAPWLAPYHTNPETWANFARLVEARQTAALAERAPPA